MDIGWILDGLRVGSDGRWVKGVVDFGGMAGF
jgi:hypothetical protein